MNFCDDLDKMYGFLTTSKGEFINSYNSTEQDYEDTVRCLQNDMPNELADLMRRAENLYIEDLNGREYDWKVNGEQLKEAVDTYAQEHLSSGEYEEYVEICESMGV